MHCAVCMYENQVNHMKNVAKNNFVELHHFWYTITFLQSGHLFKLFTNLMGDPFTEILLYIDKIWDLRCRYDIMSDAIAELGCNRFKSKLRSAPFCKHCSENSIFSHISGNLL